MLPGEGDRSIRGSHLVVLARTANATRFNERRVFSDVSVPARPVSRAIARFRAEPEAGSATTKIEDWAWHVGVPVHVLAHGVPVSETEDPSDVMRVN